MGRASPSPHPAAVYGLLEELRAAAKEDRPLVVAGARELAAALRRELTRGGVASAVQIGRAHV